MLKPQIMKNNYTLLWLLSLFTFSFISAQECPEILGSSSSATIIHFKIVDGSCSDYPSSISVASSTFDKLTCTGTDLKYGLTSGSPLSPFDTFSSDFGSGMICDYINGELRRETLSIEQLSNTVDEMRVFPNPLTNSNDINVLFSTSISAQINIFDLTGKIVLSEDISNASTKRISISSLNNGIYMLQVVADNVSTTRKIVVMK